MPDDHGRYLRMQLGGCLGAFVYRLGSKGRGGKGQLVGDQRFKALNGNRDRLWLRSAAQAWVADEVVVSPYSRSSPSGPPRYGGWV